MKATNIQWDVTDDSEEMTQEKINELLEYLPTEIEIPEDIDYNVIKSLRIEAVQKLNLYRPISIGQASRISGVSPADISVLLVYLVSYRT